MYIFNCTGFSSVTHMLTKYRGKWRFNITIDIERTKYRRTNKA